MKHGRICSMRQKGRNSIHVQMKRFTRNESFADGSVGTRVRLMGRGGYLPVRESEIMAWKYDDDYCGLWESQNRRTCDV